MLGCYGIGFGCYGIGYHGILGWLLWNWLSWYIGLADMTLGLVAMELAIMAYWVGCYGINYRGVLSGMVLWM